MSDKRPRLCIVPRWAARQDMEWYDWLCATDAVKESFAPVLRPDVQDWQEPTVASWLATLASACGQDQDELARTYFVAHSVGCQAVIRYLATLPEGTRVAGCLLVAGWWTLDAPWDSILPWVYPLDESGAAPAHPIDLPRVRAACSNILTLISDNDQFTRDWRQTERDFQARIDARVEVIPGAGHFNASDAPVVRDALVWHF